MGAYEDRSTDVTNRPFRVARDPRHHDLQLEVYEQWSAGVQDREACPLPPLRGGEVVRAAP